MDVTPLIRRDARVIQSYKGGQFKISGQVYTQSVAVMADRVVVLADPRDLSPLLPFRDEIEVLLYGTGDRAALPDPAFRKRIKEELGVTPEPMDNGAAARTYNVLMAEGRKVVAVLVV